VTIAGVTATSKITIDSITAPTGRFYVDDVKVVVRN
jgi:hypothetical protein